MLVLSADVYRHVPAEGLARHFCRRAVSVSPCVRAPSEGVVSLGDSLQVLQKKNRQLRNRLQSLRWPRSTSADICARTCTLKWSTEDRCTAEVPLPRPGHLRYLAGFFDGDGCVSLNSPGRSACNLEVGQSCDGAEVLMAFQAVFGGCVRRHRHGRGLVKPSLHWGLYGQDARHAAESLEPHSIVKKRQLQMAIDWPQQRTEREAWATELATLKRHDSALAGTLTWEYFAGFFDAEGCISAAAKSAVHLRISQKYATVLKCLQGFLADEMGIDATLSGHLGGFTLRVTKTCNSKQVLESMLHCGMIRKAESAKLALGLTLGNALQVRSAMADLTGNQQFGKRLDTAGVDRASKILSLRAQARRQSQRGQTEEAAALLQEVEILKSKHAWLNAQAEHVQLHAYLDKLLSLQNASGHLTSKGLNGETADSP